MAGTWPGIQPAWVLILALPLPACVFSDTTPSQGLSKTGRITAPASEVCRDCPSRLHDHVPRWVPGKGRCPLRASDGRCEHHHDSPSSHSASSVAKTWLIWRRSTERPLVAGPVGPRTQLRAEQAGAASTRPPRLLEEASRTQLHALVVRHSQSGAARGWGFRHLPPFIQTPAPEWVGLVFTPEESASQERTGLP